MDYRLSTLVLLFLPSVLLSEELQIPRQWEYSAPLIQPEDRDQNRSYAQKDPTVVFHDERWHVFMTIKLPSRSVIEHCSFENWQQANSAERTILSVSDSDYYCAPQVFWFEPHQLWYLIYQVGMPNTKKMWVAYSTTKTIDDPTSWTKAKPILDGGADDPRTVGGLDYWIICDDQRAYLFFTSLNGKMWRLSADIKEFPYGFANCKLALQADIFEASHTYRLKDRNQYFTIIEENGQRYMKAYVADRLDGDWHPIADTFKHPFASAANTKPQKGVNAWTDNISHGELIRDSNDQTLTVDPDNLQLMFQGLLQKEKHGRNYGQYPWRIGLLKPAK